LRLKRISLPVLLGIGLSFSLGAGGAFADNIVLKNGARLNVTGYQLVGDKYRLQMTGGVVEIAADEVERIEPEDVFAPPPPPVVPAAKGNYRDLVENSAARYKVDADLISSVIAAESNFNAKAVSRKNARGLMQLMPETAAKLGVRNVFDPQENIDAGTRYLGNLLQRYQNDLSLALAAYNAGPERVQQYGRVPPFAETQSYVRRVQRSYQTSKDAAGGKSAGAASGPGTSVLGTAGSGANTGPPAAGSNVPPQM
jgi:transglycosylase-like protein with SLT domain